MRVYAQDEDWHREMALVWGGLRESRKITAQRVLDFRCLVFGSLVASWTFAVSPIGMRHATEVLKPARAQVKISDRALWEWTVGLFRVVMENIHGSDILAGDKPHTHTHTHTRTHTGSGGARRAGDKPHMYRSSAIC
jgi:hypothetical protein